jgi:hypothetical protein
VLPKQDYQDRNARTGLPGQDCTKTWLPGKDCKDKIARADSLEMTARTEQPKQDGENETSYTGSRKGQAEGDFQDRTATTALPG